MARPKHINPETFTSGEISHGTGISMRNLQLLRDSGVSPQALEAKGGLYEMDDLIYFAMTGALQMSGIPLMESARLVQELKWEFTEFEFGYMSGLARNIFGPEVEVWTPNSEGFDFYYWLHHELRASGVETYEVKSAWENDIILLVADREYAFTDVNARSGNVKMLFGNHTVEAGPFPFCQILEDEDDGEIRLQPLHEREEWGNFSGQMSLYNEYKTALDNAVGVARVNLSLAIRNCADLVHDLRMEKGGKIFKK